MSWILVLIINGHMSLVPVDSEVQCEWAVEFVIRETKRRPQYRRRSVGDYLVHGCSPIKE